VLQVFIKVDFDKCAQIPRTVRKVVLSQDSGNGSIFYIQIKCKKFRRKFAKKRRKLSSMLSETTFFISLISANVLLSQVNTQTIMYSQYHCYISLKTLYPLRDWNPGKNRNIFWAFFLFEIGRIGTD
jgi:hypothetical protein